MKKYQILLKIYQMQIIKLAKVKIYPPLAFVSRKKQERKIKF